MKSAHIVGVDCGGTKCAIGLFDVGTQKLLHYENFPTRAKDGMEEVLRDIVAAIEQVRTPEVQALGVGVPGLVSKETGTLLHAPNIQKSDNIPIKKTLEKACGLETSVANDAACFTLAEARLGVGKGKHVVIGLTLGTGVGGGIVIDGELYHGSRGYSAEIGHMLMKPGEPPFESKDMRGEVEQFLSGTAMRQRCPDAQKPEDFLQGPVCKDMHADVFREIAWLCTSLSHLLDPDVIVFGGSVGLALAPHFKAILKELQTWMLPRSPQPLLAISKIEHAATIGAALLATKKSASP